MQEFMGIVKEWIGSFHGQGHGKALIPQTQKLEAYTKYLQN